MTGRPRSCLTFVGRCGARQFQDLTREIPNHKIAERRPIPELKLINWRLIFIWCNRSGTTGVLYVINNLLVSGKYHSGRLSTSDIGLAGCAANRCYAVFILLIDSKFGDGNRTSIHFGKIDPNGYRLCTEYLVIGNFSCGLPIDGCPGKGNGFEVVRKLVLYQDF